MKKYKLGFIGSGKMAKAIIRGLIDQESLNPSDIIASQVRKDNIEEKSKILGITVVTDNVELTNNSQTIILAVKPSQIKAVLEEIKSNISSEHLIISIAAGVTLKKLETLLPPKTKVVRVMPNTPALINEGISGICQGTYATQDDLEKVLNIFNKIGKTIIVESDSQMDIVTAISGSGPAFYYKIINDIALAGEKLGLDYKKALELSIQTAIGAAKMANKSNETLENLIANVATKGGCTRVGVDVMLDVNLENILYEVIKSTTDKAKSLSD